jgi:hypothetical protein
MDEASSYQPLARSGEQVWAGKGSQTFEWNEHGRKIGTHLQAT